MADGVSFDLGELGTVTARLAAHSAAALVQGRNVVAAAAQKIVADAQQLVPVDTGATKNSIHATSTDGGLGAEIGPTTSYAGFLEYGTVKMAPRAFMGPATDRQTPGFFAAVAQISDLL